MLVSQVLAVVAIVSERVRRAGCDRADAAQFSSQVS